MEETPLGEEEGETPEPDAADGEGEEAEEESESADSEEDSPPPDEPDPAALTPEQIEKRAKGSERAFQAYAKKISDIFADDATDLIVCPLCPDMHKGFLNVHDAGRVP